MTIVHCFAILFSFMIQGNALTSQDYTNCCPEKISNGFLQTTIHTAAFLEGAFIIKEGKMSNQLNKLGYLPGQNPKAFFAKSTIAGQPYKSKPWNYNGKEGFVKSNEFYQYPLEAVDWVLISLRENENVSSTIYKASALIYSDGDITISKDAAPCYVDSNKSYYLVVEHRNHLAVMSESAIRLVDGVITYDFRYNPSYEDGQKELTKGTYALLAGNADQAGESDTKIFIDENDLIKWKSGNGLNSSYFMMDLDLSGDVSIRDQEILYNNLGRFSTVPF